jgi:short-subunit dehydrogenase
VNAADQPKIQQAAQDFRAMGAAVEALQADLARLEDVDRLYGTAKRMNRPIDALLANAGHGLGKGFLEQDFAEIVTGSIAGFMPGTYQAVYNATKALSTPSPSPFGMRSRTAA